MNRSVCDPSQISDHIRACHPLSLDHAVLQLTPRIRSLRQGYTNGTRKQRLLRPSPQMTDDPQVSYRRSDETLARRSIQEAIFENRAICGSTKTIVESISFLY